MAKEKLKIIKIAYVARPHGIKGEAELGFLEENVLQEGMKILATPYNQKSNIPSEGIDLTLNKLKFGHKSIVSFKEVLERTHLEKLIPFEISVYREDLDDEEFYFFDLPGFDVINENNELIGEVRKVLDNGAQELLEVKLNSGEIITLPFVENFFPEMDEDKREIVMIMPEYSE